MSDYIRNAFGSDDVVKKNIALRMAHDEIERLRAREATLREALENIATQSVPRPVARRFRFDGTPSKFDLCPHDFYMWADCMACVSNYARSTLGEEEK